MLEDDTELAKRARAGSREAFDALVDRHGPGVLAYLHRLTRHHEDAQDAFQETFLRAFRSIRSLRDPSRFRPWLVRIATNTARRHLERKGRMRLVSTQETVDDHPLAGQEDASERLARGERKEAVRRAIGRLPDRQRAVISLRIDLNLPFSEIGLALDIKEDNARAHHYQALRSLRQSLAGLAKDASLSHGDST